MKKRWWFGVCGVLGFSFLASSCATQDSPPLRRVTAEEFMRPRYFKGAPSDQFIGTTGNEFRFSANRKPERAFKQVVDFGLFHRWAVIWCPVDELPEDYLRKADSGASRVVD
jgi:hypothetical protein